MTARSSACQDDIHDWRAVGADSLTRSARATDARQRAAVFAVPFDNAAVDAAVCSSARRSERSSSTPALIHERGPKEGSGDYSGSTRVGSCAGLSSRTETSRSGSCGPPACGPSLQPPPPPRATDAPQDVWIVKWVDYSSKYGVGYILSDRSVGVFFNDSTKILLDPDGSTFDYITRQRSEARCTHTLDNYPEELKKKVTLLKHFRTYMQTDAPLEKDGATAGQSSLPAPAPRLQTRRAGQGTYVKKWTKNKYAFFFQLSNKALHVVFGDKTEVVVSPKSHVTYFDKLGHVREYPLLNSCEVPCPELERRLAHAKDVLVQPWAARAGDVRGVAPAA